MSAFHSRFTNFYGDIDLKKMLKKGYPYTFREFQQLKRVRLNDLQKHLYSFMLVEYPEKKKHEIRHYGDVANFR